MTGETKRWEDRAWRDIADKVARTSRRIGANFPHASVDGQYKLEPASWWTAGFWPGLLWLLVRDGEDADGRLRGYAEQCEKALDEVVLGYERLDHDIGFMWTLTSLARYKVTGEADSRRRALLAANLLLGRFNIRGRFIRAWNPWREGDRNEGWAIIDCMMNLPLLFWASRETGDPRYAHAARAHADTALEHFVRPDGSVYHIVIFDPETGERVGAAGGQGWSEHSAWSRGTSWAIYGFALAYRYTGDERYLNAAKRISHFFLANLPADHVPVWDFRIPADVPSYRDSSAGACAASGLLLIAEQVPEPESALYRDAGERILRSLYENYGAWNDPAQEGLILHGTSHYPERKNVDVPLIYGDYYFSEGIAKLRGSRELFW
ncbi:glycoside hydrolase family 88 protein [Paenibacillus thermoaerophilus]|uniref:Glycoside hydrolase family 88 protein n=1 Tax=Paenibacillus thermoaerophilus TaxID=1215385 RepID=A0ABW2V530_9BACL|nr:glycoside hydrolase family 88 protein [Paenibacillus thermoaerophilus]TMV18435.1 glycosyl hydrolase [Paenibacillus thermoaerophilus]